jgi:iron-sulfur cluster assembly protein
MKAVTVTTSAAEHIRKALSSRGHGLGLRFGVKKSGCSGWAYHVEYADSAEDSDFRFESEGVTIFVDPDSLPYVEGTQIDYQTQGLNSSFKYLNPNVTDSCGCGESFSVS